LEAEVVEDIQPAEAVAQEDTLRATDIFQQLLE
jgi:hypothetical protein